MLRMPVSATQLDAQNKVHHIAREAASHMDHTIANQEQTIRGLSQKKPVTHQRLGDLG